MKIAIITDQHFGARKNSKLFHEYFLKFYNDVFFPTLEEHGITTIVDMGDTFDSRKGIDFSALSWAKNNYYDRLQEMRVKVHTIVGNHTAYYKNTNNVNAVDLLLREYDNVTVYSEPTEVMLGQLPTLFIPWINQENEANTLKLIEKTNCPCAMGHLELQGFSINKQIVMEHGLESKLFGKFSRVYSGHYHTRSDNGVVFYLGNPYEIYWNDVNDPRGFHIFDTETITHEPVNNPYRLFYNIYYEDTPYQTFDVREYKLYNANIAELKVVENFAIQESNEFEAFESEDTLSILNRYIEESEINLDKFLIKDLISEIYKEACEIV